MRLDAGLAPAAPSLAGLVRRNAGALADSPAVIEGRLRWTWWDLDARANAVAVALAAAGLGPGTRLALLARARAETIALVHGAALAGIVVVPLNHRLADVELGRYLAEVNVAAIAASKDQVARASRLDPEVLAIEDLAASRPFAQARGSVEPTDSESPAVIVATSGTTGKPKGAVLSHGQLAASAAAWNVFLPPATGWLASLSLAHVGGIGIVWRAALAGVPVVIPAGVDAAALLAALAERPVSHVSIVAAQLARLLEAAAGAAPPGLRAVLLGGGPLPPQLVERAIALGWPLVPTYGMTESASGVTALPTSDVRDRPGSAGRPLPGVQLRIVEQGRDAVGEIEVRGPSLFSGYFRRTQETAAATRGDGWYRSGDLGSLDADGYLTVVDRRLDLIVSGGENVYPAEVEAVLASHPAVGDAGVAARPDPKWGAVPVAAVAIRPGATAVDEELIEFCRARLAGFKVPAAIVHVPLVPRFDSGKLNRQALRALLSADAVQEHER